MHTDRSILVCQIIAVLNPSHIIEVIRRFCCTSYVVVRRHSTHVLVVNGHAVSSRKKGGRKNFVVDEITLNIMEDFDAKTLGAFKKEQLIEMVLTIQKEKNELKLQQKVTNSLDDRVTELERSHYLYKQYGRRESVEITGIPTDVDDNNLENEVIRIYNEAKVEVDSSPVTKKDISACHRIGKRGNTIVRFVNRKFASEGLYKGRNLKGTQLYNGAPVYINNSFCPEFKKYGYIIRNLKRQSLLEGYKIKNGVYQIKLGPLDKFEEISHINDFAKFGLDIGSY